MENRIVTGNLEDDLKLCADADWIIEVVAENLEIKRALLARVAEFASPPFVTRYLRPPVGRISEGLPEEWQQHWAGTHFFNPPRYLNLGRNIPGPRTRTDVIESLTSFATTTCKGVRRCQGYS